jgi:hypothetical protein
MKKYFGERVFSSGKMKNSADEIYCSVLEPILHSVLDFLKSMFGALSPAVQGDYYF